MINSHTGEMLFPYVRAFTIDRTEDFTWDAKISGQFSLPWELDMQLTGIYYAPKNHSSGRTAGKSLPLTLGIKKEVV